MQKKRVKIVVCIVALVVEKELNIFFVWWLITTQGQLKDNLFTCSIKMDRIVCFWPLEKVDILGFQPVKRNYGKTKEI